MRSERDIATECDIPTGDSVRSRLSARGYTMVFDIDGDRLRCGACGSTAHSGDVVVEEVVAVRDTDAASNAHVVALDCLSCGVKGTWTIRNPGRRERALFERLRHLHSADILALYSSALAVVAHPDDESFGLGAILGIFTDAGVKTSALCFTHGEASSLGRHDDLGDIRDRELTEAAAELGLSDVTLSARRDGGLERESIEGLTADVVASAARMQADLLITFDECGVTGHPDHRRATLAAVRAADRLDIPVLAWVVPESVAARLNDEFGTTFVGRGSHEIDVTIPVDRERQLKAIARHPSQAIDNRVLWRRLELLDHWESFRWLRRMGHTQP